MDEIGIEHDRAINVVPDMITCTSYGIINRKRFHGVVTVLSTVVSETMREDEMNNKLTLTLSNTPWTSHGSRNTGLNKYTFPYTLNP